jgi:aconitate hydratase
MASVSGNRSRYHSPGSIGKLCFSGGMMIGTDSHTPNAGGLGMVAHWSRWCRCSGCDGRLTLGIENAKVIGVKLTGKLNWLDSCKDVILWVAGHLTVKGGTGAIVEYFGEGADNMSATGKGTVCNMGARSALPVPSLRMMKKMSALFSSTGRAEVAALAMVLKTVFARMQK